MIEVGGEAGNLNLKAKPPPDRTELYRRMFLDARVTIVAWILVGLTLEKMAQTQPH